MMTDPTPEHRWLQQLVGEWTYEHTASCDGETHTSVGRETVRALGDLWIVAEMTGTVPGGGEMTCILTLGYDPAQKRFLGNWVGSPMSHMFVYDGHRDDSGNVLTLNTEGPSLEDASKTTQYQDIIDIRGPDERRFYSQSKNADGSWNRFMKGVFRRVR